MADEHFVYGIHAVASLLKASPQRVKKLLVSAKRHDFRIQQILQQAQLAELPVEFLSHQAFDLLDCQFKNNVHQGVLAICSPLPSFSEKSIPNLLDQLKHPALIMVLDSIQDPHNLGACLRTAEAFGVDFVIAPKRGAAGLTPTVCKVASGAAEMIPFVQVTNLARTLAAIRKQGIWVYGTVIEARQAINQTALTGPLALVFGSEAKGLRRLTIASCDLLISIPLLGTVGSLNVSVCAGVCLFEARRQRQLAQVK